MFRCLILVTMVWKAVCTTTDIGQAMGMAPTSHNLTSCDQNPCDNGVCENVGNMVWCNCSGTGFRDTTCSSDVDECSVGSFCNNGTCLNSVGGFHCACQTGFEGSLCEINTIDVVAEGEDDGALLLGLGAPVLVLLGSGLVGFIAACFICIAKAGSSDSDVKATHTKPSAISRRTQRSHASSRRSTKSSRRSARSAKSNRSKKSAKSKASNRSRKHSGASISSDECSEYIIESHTIA